MRKTKEITVMCCDVCGAEMGEDETANICKICGSECCTNHGELFTGNWGTEFFLCDKCIEKHRLDT